MPESTHMLMWAMSDRTINAAGVAVVLSSQATKLLVNEAAAVQWVFESPSTLAVQTTL